MIDDREIRRGARTFEEAKRAIIESGVRVDQLEQAARTFEEAKRAIIDSGVTDQLERAAQAAAPVLEQAARTAEAVKRAIIDSGVKERPERDAAVLNRMMDQLTRDAPAFNPMMDQLARDKAVLNRMMDQLTRNAPAFSRVFEQRAREIANEAARRVDQGESEESAAQYVHEEISTSADNKRWVQRGLEAKILEWLAKETAGHVLIEAIKFALENWPWPG